MMEKGASTQASSGTKLAATAMAIAGRALRPCDVCGRERAKWYCKADEAYLCEHCDGSVHGANAVSLRHERVRLGPNGMIMKNVRRLTKPEPADERDISGPATNTSTSNDRYVGFRKRPRSSRPHPSLSSSKETAKLVKAEPTSPRENFVSSPHVHEESSRKVPVFNEDLASSDDNSLGFSVPCAAPSNDDDEDMCFTLSATCDLDSFLDAEADLDGIMSGTITMEDIGDLEGVIGSPESKVFTNESFGIDFPEITFRTSCSNDASAVEGCDTPDGAMSDFCAKVKMEETDELDKIKLEVDEMLGFAFSTGAVKEEEAETKITLKLNYEDVLSAWSDRGPFWTEGPRPQSVPDDSTFDPASALESGLVPEYCMESTQAESLGQVPVVNFGDERMIAARGGREARVMRYREKRRTRLFSKKIRYEVRKLNAERRPRLKGRFVKRTTCN